MTHNDLLQRYVAEEQNNLYHLSENYLMTRPIKGNESTWLETRARLDGLEEIQARLDADPLGDDIITVDTPSISFTDVTYGDLRIGSVYISLPSNTTVSEQADWLDELGKKFAAAFAPLGDALKNSFPTQEQA